jgi:hypothetical protein
LNLSFEPWKQPTSSSFAHFSSCKYRAQDERASPRRHTPPTSQPLHLSPLQIPTSVAANPSLCSFPRAAKLFAHLVPLFSLNKKSYPPRQGATTRSSFEPIRAGE